MIVAELREALKKIDNKAVVVINGLVVHSVEELIGRVSADKQDGNGNLRFRQTPKGEQKAVTFTRHTERSDGVMDTTHHWF